MNTETVAARRRQQRIGQADLIPEQHLDSAPKPVRDAHAHMCQMSMKLAQAAERVELAKVELETARVEDQEAADLAVQTGKKPAKAKRPAKAEELEAAERVHVAAGRAVEAAQAELRQVIAGSAEEWKAQALELARADAARAAETLATATATWHELEAKLTLASWLHGYDLEAEGLIANRYDARSLADVMTRFARRDAELTTRTREPEKLPANPQVLLDWLARAAAELPDYAAPGPSAAETRRIERADRAERQREQRERREQARRARGTTKGFVIGDHS